MQILVVWPHSARNAGDYAIVTETLQALHLAHPEARVSVLVNDPASWPVNARATFLPSLKTWVAEIEPNGSQRWHKRRVFWLTPLLVMAAFFFRWFGWRVALGTPDQCMLLKAYYDADIVLGSGGNHLYARHWYNITFFWTWFSLAFAILLGKRVIILPQTVGPLHGILQHQLTSWLVSRADATFLRERRSLQWLPHALIGTRIRFAPDLAWSLPAGSWEQSAAVLAAYGCDLDRPRVGMTLMDWGMQMPGFAHQQRYEHAIHVVIERVITQLDAQVVLFSHCCGPAEPQDDRGITRRVGALFSKTGRVVVIDQQLGPEVLKAAYGQMDLFIGTRLHSVIFALSSGVPCVSIGYTHKSAGIMEDLGLHAYCLDISDVDAQSLWSKVRLTWDTRATLRLHIADAVLRIHTQLNTLPYLLDMTRRRPRVVQVVTGLAIGEQVGGAEQYGVQVARQLDPTRFESIVWGMWRFDSRSERLWCAQLQTDQIHVDLLGKREGLLIWDMLRVFWRYRQLVKATQPDIINSHLERGDLCAVLLRLTSPHTPVLVRTQHAPEQWQQRPWLGKALNHIFPLVFAAEVGVSQSTAHALDNRFVARLIGRRAHVCYNGIDEAWFRTMRSSGMESGGHSPGRPRIAAIGRLDERKGYRFLIQAAALVQRVLPEAQFFIIGDGELANELHNQVARLGLEGYVHLLGSRLDMFDLMPTFDLVVSAALWEGMPTVLLEAMACNVPVIATEVCREMVQTGRTGICVPVCDAPALAQAIIACLSNQGFRQRTTAAARQLATQWTTHATAAHYAALYDSLLSHQ